MDIFYNIGPGDVIHMPDDQEHVWSFYDVRNAQQKQPNLKLKTRLK